ncbi:MAG: formate dehydrogenase accessory sulfurtransferase FdhD [Candidatus Tectomicrobia bacterium]|nr:formate dehydrogenase accessory sulfurtransferase FdhD [Candidatus Tectomicrobia bacterium]
MRDIVRQRQEAQGPAPRRAAGATPGALLHVERSTSNAAPDSLVVEEPLEIRLDGETVSITMRTPGHDDELAVGFLFGEGILKGVDDLVALSFCQSSEDPEQRNSVSLATAMERRPDLLRLHRHFYTSSSCGVCGKTSIEAVMTTAPPVTSATCLEARTLRLLDRRMRQAQELFAQTGGLHAAALFTSAGRLLLLREDVGRHNAVDKVIGSMLLRDRLPLDSCLLMVSGRISFEIVQKALMARIPVIAAVSAPTSLAVELALQSNLTLIGFLRGEAFNIYTHPERVRNLPQRAAQLAG